MVGSQLVVRDTPRGKIICNAPPKGRRPLTPAQQAWHDKFREAVEYGKSAKSIPEYVTIAKKRKTTPQTVATGDILRPPEVRDVNLSRYHGKVGDEIRVVAVDNVMVAVVGIMIVDENNTFMEAGLMTLAGGGGCLWTYAATCEVHCSHVRVFVDAADLAGNIGSGGVLGELEGEGE